MLEYALNYAAIHGRRAVVEFLLSKGPDLRVVEPIWNNTLLQAIEYRGQHPEILALIRPLFG
jgi:ankyrin repeat protein